MHGDEGNQGKLCFPSAVTVHTHMYGSQNSSVTAPRINGQGRFSQAGLAQICLGKESQAAPMSGLELRKEGQTAHVKKLPGT